MLSSSLEKNRFRPLVRIKFFMHIYTDVGMLVYRKLRSVELFEIPAHWHTIQISLDWFSIQKAPHGATRLGRYRRV
jgi:hypothetical protein